MALFQNSVLNKYKKLQDQKSIEKAFKKYAKYFHNSEIQQNIRESKEEQYQEGFLRELFVNILDYTINPNPNFNLTTELKNEKGAKKADGAILNKSGKAIAVIELKGTKTIDLESIRQQAFDYKANQSSCVYVITSNFEKLRFYINNAVEFEEFNLFTLTAEGFELLYLCLNKENLLQNLPLKINTDSVVAEEQITKTFYKDYSIFKRELFRDLVKKNVKNEIFREELQKDDNDRATKNIKLSLFKKSQKLIDRFLFIFFAEDKGLLPPNSTLRILDDWNKLNELDTDIPLYNRFKLYFKYLDEGRKGTDKKAEIFAYNGGLFKPDPILDSLLIDNDLLFRHTKKLSDYDFESQVGVNILGHIFENSLNEIESVNAEIEGTAFDKQKTKRKKDGVFYTPKYITKYIVDNTVGKLCEEKKTELGVIDADYQKSRKGRNKDTIINLKTKLDTYRDWLLELTILDPACGSGAFLNQALDFLIKEHTYIDELETSLLGGGMVFPNIENTILEKNIFGVDLNEESVEIAKLSLWLRTAQPRRKLNTLNNNIKCGNSLIDDPKVAGDRAFNWQNEFPNVFSLKDKEAFHVVLTTHNSRTSQRMINLDIKKGPPIELVLEEEIALTKIIGEIIQDKGYHCLEYNICKDHVHLILVCEATELTSIVQAIKSISSRLIKPFLSTSSSMEHVPLGSTTPLDSAVPLGSTTPLDSTDSLGSHKKGDKTYTPFWSQKFYRVDMEVWQLSTLSNKPGYVYKETHLENALVYIRHNRLKHELPVSKELVKIIDGFISTQDVAFRKEHKGGFDVVIGNPPYVRAELLGEFQDYLMQNYSLHNPSGDLFSYFYEKSFKLLNTNTGLFGFISNTFDKTTAGISIREYLQTKISFLKYIDFTEVRIFEGATTYPVIIIAKNIHNAKNNFQFIKIPKTSQSTIIDIDLHHSVTVEQLSLEELNWSFKSKSAVNLISKLKKNKPIREIYGKTYRGLLTGLNEAFIISKDFEVGDHIKPIFEGKELSKWVSSESVQQLILFKSKWTKKEYGNETTEEKGIQKLANDYPELLSHILPLKERAKKRYDKGDFFWELRNCAYYDLFEKPKIVFPNLQNSNKFSFDETGAYINAPAVILPTNDKFLTAILNSKLVWYLLTNICVVRSGGYIEVKPQYFEQIPIPIINNSKELEEKTISIIEFTSKLQKIGSRFTNYLQSQFSIEKLTKKLQNWHELDFGDFIKELNKAIKKQNKERVKVELTPITTLTKTDEMDWMDVFETKKAEAQTLKSQIDNTDNEIDQMVYELYKLTAEEIAIIENSTK